MIISFFKHLYLLLEFTKKEYSPLRIYQIIETSKINIDGKVLDLGSKDSQNNILNYNKEIKDIKFADKFSDDKKILSVDLEIYPNKFEECYKYVFLFNVLEHIKNFDNCFKNIFQLLDKGGKFIGSTPFLFRIHPSPNDYLRFTNQFLNEKLSEHGFKNIKIKVLLGGIFISFYSNIFTLTNKIPLNFLLNYPLFLFCLILDKFLSLFSSNIKKNYPIGYYFIAEK